jgi:hypothetical protein
LGAGSVKFYLDKSSLGRLRKLAVPPPFTACFCHPKDQKNFNGDGKRGGDCESYCRSLLRYPGELGDLPRIATLPKCFSRRHRRRIHLFDHVDQFVDLRGCEQGIGALWRQVGKLRLVEPRRRDPSKPRPTKPTTRKLISTREDGSGTATRLTSSSKI